MNRGKQQILLNYLPGKTFDFEKIGTIARIERIRGVPRTDLNIRLILHAVEEQVREWSDDKRPIFLDLERASDRFALVEPRGVEAAMFPLVFWCQNTGCGVLVETRDGVPRSDACAACRGGRLVQLRFVRVHRCGAIEPLSAQYCSACDAQHRMALVTRGSERISDFQWLCRSCGATTSVFAGRCRACSWPGVDQSLKNMSIEVHRARRTFYPHYTVMLNQPGQELSAFLGLSRWQAVAAAAYLNLPELRGRRFVDFTGTASAQADAGMFLTDAERARLRSQGVSEEMISQFESMQAQLQKSRTEVEDAGTPQGMATTLITRSGVTWDIWERAGQELLEAVMPLQTGEVTELFREEQIDESIVDQRSRAQESARRLGLGAVTLATDFPITTATFGYSRVDDRPNTCRVNPFPADPDQSGKFPIFVDVVQADAILLRLDPAAVLAWMAVNGVTASVPYGDDPDVCTKAYFVRLFDGVSLRQTIQNVEVRLAFGLLHTFSHLAVRRAALLCGLDGTSLSEYVLPRALTTALYCNHRFGATIGALSALFEQSVAEWLSEVRTSRRCVYDPVCADQGGSCHACSHLAETSCRFFNLNLGRSFLFGGADPVLGEIRVGFVDFNAGR